MNVDFSTQELSKTLALLKPLTVTKNTLPILSTALIVAGEDDAVTINATDLEVTCMAQLHGCVVHEPGMACLPVRRTPEVLKGKGTTNLMRTDTAFILNTGMGLVTLDNLDPYDYPKTQEEPTPVCDFTLPSEVVRDMLRVLPYASRSEVQYFINSIYIRVKPGALHAVATDSHQMAVWECPNALDNKDQGFAVPLKAVDVLIKAIGKSKTDPVSFHFMRNAKEVYYGGRASFSVGNVTIQTRLVDGEYPAYEQIIPKDSPLSASLSREETICALEDIKPFVNPLSFCTRWEFMEHELAISVTGSKDASASATTKTVLQGDPFTIGLNVNYAIKALKSFNVERLRIEARAPTKTEGGDDRFYPLMLSGDKRLRVLIQPMRIE